jgi:hypothetical protein
MANKNCTLELDVETVNAIGRHFDRRAAEQEGETAIGRAIQAREFNARRPESKGKRR